MTQINEKNVRKAAFPKTRNSNNNKPAVANSVHNQITATVVHSMVALSLCHPLPSLRYINKYKDKTFSSQHIFLHQTKLRSIMEEKHRVRAREQNKKY